MMMMKMIQTKIFTNQNGRFLFEYSGNNPPVYSSDDITEWDQAFIKRFTVQEGTLFDIIMVNPFPSH